VTRKMHLVGAWPGVSGAQAMQTAFVRLGRRPSDDQAWDAIDKTVALVEPVR
jgi:hypothetical protein